MQGKFSPGQQVFVKLPCMVAARTMAGTRWEYVVRCKDVSGADFYMDWISEEELCLKEH